MWLLGNLSNCVVELTLFLKQPSGFTLTPVGAPNSEGSEFLVYPEWGKPLR
jgi:hypothetical protein